MLQINATTTNKVPLFQCVYDSDRELAQHSFGCVNIPRSLSISVYIVEAIVYLTCLTTFQGTLLDHS